MSELDEMEYTERVLNALSEFTTRQGLRVRWNSAVEQWTVSSTRDEVPKRLVVFVRQIVGGWLVERSTARGVVERFGSASEAMKVATEVVLAHEAAQQLGAPNGR